VWSSGAWICLAETDGGGWREIAAEAGDGLAAEGAGLVGRAVEGDGDGEVGRAVDEAEDEGLAHAAAEAGGGVEDSLGVGGGVAGVVGERGAGRVGGEALVVALVAGAGAAPVHGEVDGGAGGEALGVPGAAEGTGAAEAEEEILHEVLGGVGTEGEAIEEPVEARAGGFEEEAWVVGSWDGRLRGQCSDERGRGGATGGHGKRPG
jgi:hypothetical protein